MNDLLDDQEVRVALVRAVLALEDIVDAQMDGYGIPRDEYEDIEFEAQRDALMNLRRLLDESNRRAAIRASNKAATFNPDQGNSRND